MRLLFSIQRSVLGVAFAALLASPQSTGPASEVLQIDARVVARDGTPMPGLRPDQFEVALDDGARVVVSAELRDPRTHRPTVAAGGADRFPGGRLIVIAVDQASFPPSATAAVAEAANRVVAAAAPDDYLGIVIFPEWASVVPTRNREAIRGVIGKLSGVRRDIATPRFQVSASDAMLLRSGDATAIQTIVGRECSFAFNPTCRNEVLQDGSAIAEVLEHQSRLSLNGLYAAVDALAAIPERKTVILLSAGLPMTVRPGARLDQRADTSRLVQLTAVAGVDLNVLYLNGRFLRHFSPEYRKRHYAIFDDIRAFGTSLQGFAEMGGGSFSQVEVERDSSVERVFRETSAYYSLGVQLRPEDRDGKEHLVRIGVKDRAATVRYRRVVTIPGSHFARPSSRASASAAYTFCSAVRMNAGCTATVRFFSVSNQ